jgi:hypothetical protein
LRRVERGEMPAMSVTAASSCAARYRESAHRPIEA